MIAALSIQHPQKQSMQLDKMNHKLREKGEGGEDGEEGEDRVGKRGRRGWERGG